MFLKLGKYYINTNTIRTLEVIENEIKEPDPANPEVQLTRIEYFLVIDNDLEIRVNREEIANLEEILEISDLGLTQLGKTES